VRSHEFTGTLAQFPRRLRLASRGANSGFPEQRTGEASRISKLLEQASRALQFAASTLRVPALEFQQSEIRLCTRRDWAEAARDRTFQLSARLR